MPEHPTPVNSAPPRRDWLRRLARAFTLLFLVLVVALVLYYFYNRYQAERGLQEAIAEADRLDPGWRWEEYEKKRTALPPEQNAAIHITAALQAIPEFMLPDEFPLDQAEASPQRQVDTELAARLRKAIEPVLPALTHIHKAAALKSAWYPVQWTPDVIKTDFAAVMATRRAGVFLSRLALLQIQDGKIDEAWQTAMAILVVDHSLDEEPVLSSFVARAALRNIAVMSFERCLAQGKVSDTLLAQTQLRLEQEAEEPILLRALRGERAGIDMLLTNIEAGKIDLAELLGNQKDWSVSATKWWYSGSSLTRSHAWLLRYHNQAVEYAKLPPTEMLAKMRSLDFYLKTNNDASSFTRALCASVMPVANYAVRTQLRLECSVAAIGVERFRMKHERWPESLQEVVAERFLQKVPVDYFNDRPIGYRKPSDGVVVFSVGQNKDYAGDFLDVGKEFDPIFPSLITPSNRMEFRLWDEKHRRQPSDLLPLGG
jgi:hypothetical protein